MPRHRRRLPPLNSLRAFEAAGRQLNFRKAAEELGVTQGAVAQQVRLLESDLGMPLFERLSHSVRLTEAGRSYAREVSRAFAVLADATNALVGDSGHVTLNVTPSVAARWLIPRLPDFGRKHPGVEISILATEQMPDFREVGADLAIREVYPPFGKGIRHLRLFARTVVAVANPELVATLGTPTMADDLAKFTLLHDVEHEWPLFLEKLFGSRHVKVANNLSLNFATLAIDAAIAGQGLALASTLLVNEDLKAGRLVQLFDISFSPGNDYHLLLPMRGLERLATKMVCDWLIVGATAGQPQPAIEPSS